jgi:exosortase/archaeosortase family protein
MHAHGWFEAAGGTFDISIIVLAACFAGLSLILADKTGEVQTPDLILSAMLLLLIALPIGATSWLAVTILSLYILNLGQSIDSRRRGAIILLAVTVPMLWSRLVFNLFARFILEVDATLVGWMLGTHRIGNVVEFADRSGSLAIFPGCSSLANVSLALLCWVAVSQYVKHKWRPQDILWCLLACFSVVAVNVLRISLMGINEAHYLMMHSPLAEALLSIVMLSLVISISLAGTRHDAIFHA